MDIRSLPIGKLRPAAYNPRVDLTPEHEEYQKIKRSIEEFGYVEPVIVNKDFTVIGGHQRVKVLKDLGHKEIQCVVVDIDKTKEKALNIALNKISGDWDRELLKDLLLELDSGVIDVTITGFDMSEIEDLMTAFYEEPKEEEGFDERKALEEIEVVVTERGDIWLLGDHVLMCGDSSSLDDVAKVMTDKGAQMVFTSPPYADQREYDTESEFKPIRHEEYIEWFTPIAKNIRLALKDTGSFFLNLKEDAVDGERSLYVMELVIFLKKKLGFRYIDELIWKKPEGGMPGRWNNRFKNGFEPIHYFAKDPYGVDCNVFQVEIMRDLDVAAMMDNYENVFHFGKTEKIKFHPQRRGTKSDNVLKYDKSNKNINDKTGNVTVSGEVKQGIALPSNVISIMTNKETLAHPAMYSVKLVEWFLHVFTDRRDTIFEPFSGSGTNIIASENMTRKCVAMEISPKYCDLAVRRFAKHVKSLEGVRLLRSGREIAGSEVIKL